MNNNKRAIGNNRFIKNHRVMKTKNHYLYFLVLSVFLLLGTSCRVYQPHTYYRGQVVSSRPYGKQSPGHMKKMDGERSAKEYAPGHNKKHRRDDDRRDDDRRDDDRR
jgi:hypothetical protein